MMVDDIAELFGLFAQETGANQQQAGSGLLEPDQKVFYDYYYVEETPVSNFIGPKEVVDMWDYLHIDRDLFLRKMKGECGKTVYSTRCTYMYVYYCGKKHSHKGTIRSFSSTRRLVSSQTSTPRNLLFHFQKKTP